MAYCVHTHTPHTYTHRHTNTHTDTNTLTHVLIPVRLATSPPHSIQMEKNLRGQSAYTILDTRNDGVRFTNSKLQALSEECAALREQYETAQEALVEEVVQVAGG